MTSAVQGAGGRRVATVELLFDLTFVFAITQITHLLKEAHTPGDLIGALAVLTFLWWMYGGYVWLASHIASQRALTAVMLIAMAGTFFLAVGLKEHFGLEAGGADLSFWLSFGLALYFAGTALFRHGLKLGGVVPRLAAAIAGGLLGLIPLSAAGILSLALVIALIAIAADATAGRVSD